MNCELRRVLRSKRHSTTVLAVPSEYAPCVHGRETAGVNPSAVFSFRPSPYHPHSVIVWGIAKSQPGFYETYPKLDSALNKHGERETVRFSLESAFCQMRAGVKMEVKETSSQGEQRAVPVKQKPLRSGDRSLVLLELRGTELGKENV